MSDTDEKFEQEMLQEVREEYLRLSHAMQSGVAAEMGFNPAPTEPKHLRVGINAAMSDQSGLAELLIRKGLITRMEYYEAMRDAMKREVERYKERLSAHYGKDVELH